MGLTTDFWAWAFVVLLVWAGVLAVSVSAVWAATFGVMLPLATREALRLLCVTLVGVTVVAVLGVFRLNGWF